MPFFKTHDPPHVTVNESTRCTVLLVDDEPDNLQVLSAILAPHFNILQACNGAEALALVQSMPDPHQICVIISDQRMPELTGVELCERLYAIIPDTLRIIVTGYIDVDAIVDAINRAHLYQFVIKPYDRHDFELVVKRAVEAFELKRQLKDYMHNLEEKIEQRTLALAQTNQQLQQTLQQLEQMSICDALTGLHNRHYLLSVIGKDLALIQRAKKQEPSNSSEHDLLFFMIDCDHFKQINDEYGHDVGDQLLCAVTQVLQQVFRASDYLVRWGGEEFLVVVRFFPGQQAATLAERLRLAIEAMCLTLPDGRLLRRTCSLGYAVLPGAANFTLDFDWQKILKLADYAMYCAKKNGRNTWVGIHLEDETGLCEPSQLQNSEIALLLALGQLRMESRAC